MPESSYALLELDPSEEFFLQCPNNEGLVLVATGRCSDRRRRGDSGTGE